MLCFRSFVFSLILCCSFLWSAAVQAKIQVLFHPTDPTLETIATWLTEAKHTIDIAMYDLETSKASPVIAALAEPSIQARLASGDLSVRFIFEGYGTPIGNFKKMAELEALGLDVRFVTSGKKVHHKFAVIDASIPEARVITGSANWSITSYRNYDENILFLDQEPLATAEYETEFESLWAHSSDFGTSKSHADRTPKHPEFSISEIKAHFNSPRHLLKDLDSEHYLTAQIVKLIDEAKEEILIATTRSRIKPILKSLRAAAERGVQIKLLLGQDDFHDLQERGEWLFGHSNIEVRIKFYNLNTGDFLLYQMHNKWMVVDRSVVMTGSFNWSNSSENSHIENILILKGLQAAEVMPSFLARFELLWERGRENLPSFQEQLSLDQSKQVLPRCAFAPMSLRYQEAKDLLSLAPRCRR